MRDVATHLKDQTPEHVTPQVDRLEVARAWLHSGLVEGVSMEWVLDRITTGATPKAGRA